MQGEIQGAFGKLKRNEEDIVTDWHPLVDHLLDVTACFQQLCQCYSIRRALETTAGRPLQPQDLARLAVLVFFHDLGKANSGFQSKRFTRDNRPRHWPLPAGHGPEARNLFADEALTPLLEQLPVEAMCTWGDGVDALLTASISHHGRPVVQPAQDNPYLWKPVTAPDGIILYDPGPILQQMGRLAMAVYPDAFADGGQPLPVNSAFGHLFAGLVQLADWLGSDTRFFPYSIPGEDRAGTVTQRARQAVGSLGLDGESWRQSLDELPPTFASAFGIDSPYPAQASMDDAGLGPLVILESETGSGKTEAALWRFVHLFRAGKVDSLYFALPTRVSATQVYYRIHATIRRLWPQDAPVTVRALPGYASADGQEAVALPDFRVLWPDQPEDEVAQRRWAAESPKRFLAAPIAVGTIDQALLGALQVRHAHLRHALLSRSLLVVDEVHASDAYMTVLLERLLKAHLGCGGQALLLSATLGSSARSRYLALGSGKARPMLYDQAKNVPYPALADFASIRPLASSSRSKTVTWQTFDAMDDPERIAGMALEAALQGAKVLIIRNTVPAAVAVLKVIEEAAPQTAELFTVNGISTLHHSRFSRQDRPVLDKAIEAHLGKHRPLGPRIVVGTQTLEQSLDIDADLLITDLCPMDVLLQRIGRLHRHHRGPDERPVLFREAQAWVLTPPNHDLGPMLTRPRHGLGRFRDGGGVYPDLRVVEATRILIDSQPRITIPLDNRHLVEAATHPQRLQAIQDALGSAWQELGRQIEGDTGAKRTVAHLQGLDMDQAFDETEGFPNGVKIATRLGVEDRLALFDPPLPGPFGELLRQLPIRHFLLPTGLDPDIQPSSISLTEGMIEFNLGEVRFRYSRLGLEKL